MQGEDADDAPMRLGVAAVRRPGRDVSIVTYGGSLPRALAAAETLAQSGIEAEVLDLRSLRPLDVDAIVATVAKTHRAVVVDEMWRTGSFAAEVSAQIMERAFDELDAPVARVCSIEVPMPYAKHLEDAALPSPDRIVAAVRSLL
jgi:pyruvate dehydrogenase E1 component beta subunit